MQFSNIYFFNREAPILEKHEYAFIGGCDDPANMQMDTNLHERMRVCIQEKIIEFNQNTNKSRPKAFSFKYIVEENKELWQSPLHWKPLLKRAAALSFVCFGAMYWYLSEEVDEISDAFTKNQILYLATPLLSIAFSQLFGALSELQQERQASNGSKFLHLRYWKIIKLETKNSSTAQLFFEAINNAPTPQTLRESVGQYLPCLHFSHPSKIRFITEWEKNAFLNYLGNTKEVGQPVDVVTFEPISKNILWTTQTIAIGKFVFKTRMLLKIIFNKMQKNEGEIPHPFWDKDMSKEEKEKFLEDIAIFACFDKKKISRCWKKSDYLLTEWAIERLNNRVPQWSAYDKYFLELEKNSIRNYLPTRRFTLLPCCKIFKID